MPPIRIHQIRSSRAQKTMAMASNVTKVAKLLSSTTSSSSTPMDRLINGDAGAMTGGADSDDAWLYVPGEVFNRPIHAVLLAILIVIAALLNGLIICNIRKHELKARTITFVLIEYMCMLDFAGAIVMLPFPLYASVNGGWTLGRTVCSVNAAINVGIWIQHFVLYVLLKFDRTSASCLPIGRYPLFTARAVRIFLTLSLVFAFSMSTAMTVACGGRFHTVALLCTPRFPKIVYGVLLLAYSASLVISMFSYTAIIIYLKQQQRKIYSVTCCTQLPVRDHKHNIHSAFILLYITVTNLVVSVPTMFVIGRPDVQALLHPFVLLVVDGLFYAEFLMHSLILLSLSGRLRHEVKNGLLSFVKQCAASI